MIHSDRLVQSYNYYTVSFLVYLSNANDAYPKCPRFSKSLQHNAHDVIILSRLGNINRLFAENSSALLYQTLSGKPKGRTLKNRRNSSGSPLLLINFTTHTPSLYRITRISPSKGHFRLSIWWIGILMFPATSMTSSDKFGVTTFWTCSAPIRISKSSGRGRIEWNWVNLSGGHKSRKREARWVYIR